MWSMGLLQPGDWKADWIGYDKPRRTGLLNDPLDQARWIWHPADAPEKVPKCQRLFAYSFTLPNDVKVKQAEVSASADDGMKFAVNAQLRLITEAKNDSWRQLRKANVTADLRPGQNELRVLVENAEPGYAGLIARLIITLADGRIIEHHTGDSWKSTDQPGQDWMNDPLDTSSWPAARVLGDYGMQPWGKLRATEIFVPPATCLRGEFRLDRPVARAMLYVTALGLVEMHLNGDRVSDDFFTPGWSDYKKRVYYRAYDVTKLVRPGANALGAVLADGWFSGYIGYGNNRAFYGKYPRLRAQLHLDTPMGPRPTSAPTPAGRPPLAPSWRPTSSKAKAMMPVSRVPSGPNPAATTSAGTLLTSAVTKCVRWCKPTPVPRCARSRNSKPGRSRNPSPACTCSTWARTLPACRA